MYQQQKLCSVKFTSVPVQQHLEAAFSRWHVCTKGTQHSRAEEATRFTEKKKKKKDSAGNLDSNSNFIAVRLNNFGPGMVDEADEAFLNHKRKEICM